MSEQRELQKMKVRVLIADLRDINHSLTTRAADALSLILAELELAIATNEYLRKQLDHAEDKQRSKT